MPAPDPELSTLLRRELSRVTELEGLTLRSPELQAFVERLIERRVQRLERLQRFVAGEAPPAPLMDARSTPSEQRSQPARGAPPPVPPQETPQPAPSTGQRPAIGPGEARLEAARMLTPSVRELSFRTGGALRWSPGQYVRLRVPVDGGPLTRSYSIARCEPAAGRFTLWIKRVAGGPVSSHLHTLPPGSTLEFTGPTGAFLLEPPGAGVTRVVLIGTGTGLAPLFAQLTALLEMRSWQGPIDLLWGVRLEEDIFYADVLSEMRARRPGLSITLTLSDAIPGSNRAAGRVTDLVNGAPASWLEGAVFYLAGNGQMISDVIALLRGRGVAAGRIHTEAFFKG